MNTTKNEVLNITQTLAKARSLGYTISEYCLHRALKEGKIPCRIVGRTYFIAWSNFERWLLCVDGSDNQASDSLPESEPEPIELTSQFGWERYRR